MRTGREPRVKRSCVVYVCVRWIQPACRDDLRMASCMLSRGAARPISARRCRGQLLAAASWGSAQASEAPNLAPSARNDGLPNPVKGSFEECTNSSSIARPSTRSPPCPKIKASGLLTWCWHLWVQPHDKRQPLEVALELVHSASQAALLLQARAAELPTALPLPLPMCTYPARYTTHARVFCSIITTAVRVSYEPARRTA